MDGFDIQLRERLARLDAAVPIRRGPRRAHPSSRPMRVSVALAAAVSLAFFAAGLAVGAFVDPLEQPFVRGHEGFENQGQPFYGTALHCMAPPEAHRVITGRGYGVTWQIEDRDGAGRGTTTLSSTPPPTGVIEGGFVEGDSAHVVVAVGSGASVAPDCG
jgi:hypothetical protein